MPGLSGTGHLIYWITHCLHLTLSGTRVVFTNTMARSSSVSSTNHGLEIGGGIFKYVLVVLHCQTYKFTPVVYRCFYRCEKHQSSLPDVDGAVPFCFILYADKTKLSSFGTVKGYPVVVRCANLPTHIRNGEAFGGGRVVGWLPIVSRLFLNINSICITLQVPEDAGEEGKLGYTTLKRVVWHESFKKLLEHAAQYSKTGYSHKSHNDILRWLFPVILILSADYEEQ